MEQIIAAVRGFDGALVVAPGPGGTSSGPTAQEPAFPELTWGDSFFYYAPDGRLPRTGQPYGTIVTKDYPDDTASDLDPPGRWRVNVHVDRDTFRRLTGEEPRALALPRDHAAADQVVPHPVYGALGWICVVTPGPLTTVTVLGLLHGAHDAARARHARRRGTGGEPVAD
ncbi:DUF6194 family protein [Streptomyces sp. NPDC049881]|uniref:DUF6194 family protein n=1 Tax=Streptomyces sp. NPDC049881 TaxID=3155778 RepID=UPI0034253DFC